MPIDIKCPGCERKFRVADKFAGKRVKCPKCQGVISVPAAKQPAAKQKATQKSAPKKGPKKEPQADQPQADQWYLQIDDGEEYGPISFEELEQWIEDGRVDASCQILREGWEQWKWAEDVFPKLGEGTEPPAKQPEENPFAGIVDAGPSAPAPGVEINPYEPPQTSAAAAAPGVSTAADSIATPGVRRAMTETRPWVAFLSILGFILGGLALLGSMFSIVTFMAFFGYVGLLIGLMAMAGPAFYLVASYYLFTYASKIRTYLRGGGSHQLEGALLAQKSFWKLVGIVTLIVLGLYLLMIVLMIALGGLAAVSTGPAVSM